MTKDEIGRAIPPGLLKAFEDAERLREVVAAIHSARKAVEGLAGVDGAEFVAVAQLSRDLKAIAKEVSHARYWTDCPRCQGETQPKCGRCAGRGWFPFRDRKTLDAAERQWLGLDP